MTVMTSRPFGTHAAVTRQHGSWLLTGVGNTDGVSVRRCFLAACMELRAVPSLDMPELQGGGDGGDGEDGPCSDEDSYESLPRHASFSTHMTAGAVAGVLEHTVMFPVDSVKVKLPRTPTYTAVNTSEKPGCILISFRVPL